LVVSWEYPKCVQFRRVCFIHLKKGCQGVAIGRRAYQDKNTLWVLQVH
jgi:DhnA family fructose-bisphosphate aldolase class Ia